MKVFSTKYCCFVLLLLCFTVTAKAQTGLCPSNLDFEQGTFAGWECRTGSALNTLPLPVIGQVAGRHTIVSTATAGTDPYGGFPTLCPNGSNFSVKLGNNLTGTQAESISYTYTIPASLTTFSMLFHYAVVLQNPGHPPVQQPRFRARIVDVATGLPINCVDFDFISGASTGGFFPSPINSGVLCKDWTPVSINLTAYIGTTIMLEFVTADCTQGGHFGYAYLDVNTNCNGVIAGNFICPGDTAITLNAPFGFQSYEWFADASFSSTLSNTQTLYVNPLPAVGTIYPVVVTPYVGFGCKDTLYATIDVGTLPAADAGPDQVVCNVNTTQIGAPPNPAYSYIWWPPPQVSANNISNPIATVLTAGPELFYVTTTDILTGCKAKDSVYLTLGTVDTALTVTGKPVYCVGDPAAGTLTVSNGLLAIQWYDGFVPIPGATGTSYHPTTSGNYWAQVQQGVCTDSTRTIVFAVNPIPASAAGPDASICLKQTIQIGVPSVPAYNYTWTPAAQVSNAAIGDPFAWALNGTTVEFIVRTADPTTGCYSQDTLYITGRVVDTAISLAGKKDYCTGDLAAGTLSVTNAATAIQWYDGTTALGGATGSSYHPVAGGNYWAQIQQFGCTDSTATVPFIIHDTPIPLFTASSDTGCVTLNSFTFTNNSNAPDGAPMTYLWKFSDGTTQAVMDAVKTFISTGLHTVKLITTTSFGCVDSTGFTTVRIMPNAVAGFKWDSVCINRPSLFYNLSNENGSPQVNYSWNFNNGGPLSLIKDPSPVIYTTSGQVDVTLVVTALGCENDPKSVVKKVQANVSKPGIRYRDITVPEGAKTFIHARDSVGLYFQWMPAVQLRNYNTRYTEFTAINDVLYQIKISDNHTCVTIDTLQMLVLKKPGYYLPTAFTPNGDGLNDVARPYLVRMKSLVSFSVFNRWGDRIFYSQEEGKGWDGRFNGVTQSSGVYIWILEFMDINNKKVTEKGTIALIR